VDEKFGQYGFYENKNREHVELFFRSGGGDLFRGINFSVPLGDDDETDFFGGGPF